jgi:hypothetical protein
LSNTPKSSENRLLDLWAVHDLTPDPGEVEASRNFHIEYWLGLAESAIAADHRQTCYGSLTPDIREQLEDIANPLSADKATVAALRRDLAFLEGHVRAYRDVIQALRDLAAARRQQPLADQDCGSRAA